MTPAIRRLAVGAGVASLMALAACGEPTGHITPNGSGYVATFSTDFQEKAGEPIVRAEVLCAIPGMPAVWRRGTFANVRDLPKASDGDTVTRTASCFAAEDALAGGWCTRPSYPNTKCPT